MSEFEDLALKYVLADDESVQRDAAQSAADSKHRTTLFDRSPGPGPGSAK